VKSLSIFAVMVFALFQFGCTTSTPAAPGVPTPPSLPIVGCSVETIVTTAAAGAIASADSCTNVTQIAADIQKSLGSINLCGAAGVQAQLAALKLKQGNKFKGIVGDIVCPLATDAIMSIIGTAVPSAWGCTGSASVSSSISAACIAAVPI
jgi:hypothetical protein